MRGMTSDEMLIGGPHLSDLGGSTTESDCYRYRESGGRPRPLVLV